MLRRRHIDRVAAAALCLALACASARADWIILKDGRAAKVVRGRGAITQVEFPDCKRRDVERTEIARRLTDRLFDREVGQVITVQLNSRQAKAKVVAADETSATLRVEGADRTVRMPQPRSARWIGGYISPESFQAGKHGWADPKRFIEAYGRRKAPRQP